MTESVEYLKWGAVGTAGIAAPLSGIAFIMNLWISPLKDSLIELRSEVRVTAVELKRIADLAAARGVEIPQLRIDMKRLEDRVDRIEQNRAPPR